MPAFKLQLGCPGSDKKDRKLQVVVVPFATIVMIDFVLFFPLVETGSFCTSASLFHRLYWGVHHLHHRHCHNHHLCVTWLCGYGSIPINTIISGMNIHLPAILGFTRYQGFDPSPCTITLNHMPRKSCCWFGSLPRWSKSSRIPGVVRKFWPVGVEICDVLGVNINGIHWTSIDLLFWCFTKVGSWTTQERCKHQPTSNDPHNDHLGGREIGGWWWLF